ncbi:MAG TPA: helix-turn-helix domain-containing protein [Archangium sp.]
MPVYPAEFRLRVVREVLEQQTPIMQVARIFQVSSSAIHNWLRAYELGGVEALTPVQSGPAPAAPSDEDARRDFVLRTRQENPEFGPQRISDVLKRFEGLGVSETTVRRILHEEGLLEAKPPQVEKAPRPETRF